MKLWLNPVQLEGKTVRLVPLTYDHKEGMLNALSDGKLWNLWYTGIPSEQTLDQYLDFALEEQAQQRALPFVIVEKTTGDVIGSTRFCNVAVRHKRVEIGYTWYAKRMQRTGANTECKFLLLQHAFETLETIAVEIRTNWHNHRSRTAIERLGAKRDGVLRNHMIDHNGLLRDTVVYSIIEQEWKPIKFALQFKMQQQYD